MKARETYFMEEVLAVLERLAAMKDRAPDGCTNLEALVAIQKPAKGASARSSVPSPLTCGSSSPLRRLGLEAKPQAQVLLRIRVRELLPWK